MKGITICCSLLVFLFSVSTAPVVIASAPQHHKLASLAHHYCHSGCMASHTLHAQLVWPADGWCASAPDQSICFEIVTASGNGIFHLQCTRG